MELVNWMIAVNKILENSGCDGLFNKKEIEMIKNGCKTVKVRTTLQKDAELAWKKGLSAQEFVQSYC